MSELLVEESTSERSDHDAVQEMYTQAVNNNALDEHEKTLLEEAATEVGTTVENLEAAHRARQEAAQRSLQSKAAQHAIEQANATEYWAKPKE